jgi:hypothetical protein
MTELALSLIDQYQQNRSLLSRPISSLAHKAGLRVNDVYSVLIKELLNKDLGEAIRYAEIGLKYATIVDRNRLREECGEEFILSISTIINIVKDGLESKEPWIKRKAIQLHGSLVDEAAEKQRFVETFMIDKKLELIKESQENIKKLEKEIIDFEAKDGVFTSI